MATQTARREARDSMIRVHPDTHESLKEWAARERVPVTQLVDRLVAEERRRRWLLELNEAFERLKADPARWAAYQAEGRELDGTVADGLRASEEVEWEESLTDSAAW
jgi:hypothetical protein